MGDTPEEIAERQKAEVQDLKSRDTIEPQEDDPERAAELRRVAPESYDPRLDPQHQDPTRLPQDVRAVREEMGEKFESEWGVDSERAQERQESHAAEPTGTARGGSRKRS